MCSRRDGRMCGWMASLRVRMALTADAATGREALDFVHLTDTHVIYTQGVHPWLLEMRKMFASTIDTLPQDLERCRRERLGSFAFITGDLTDVHSFFGAKGGAVGKQDAIQPTISIR